MLIKIKLRVFNKQICGLFYLNITESLKNQKNYLN